MISASSFAFTEPFPKHQDIGVVVRQDAGWTLFVKEPVAGLDGVDLGDEGPQIDVGRLPVLGSCLYHVEALAKTELKTNRYQGARGEERGEKAALLQASDIAVHFLKQPVGVMVFGKADGHGPYPGATEGTLRDGDSSPMARRAGPRGRYGPAGLLARIAPFRGGRRFAR